MKTTFCAKTHLFTVAQRLSARLRLVGLGLAMAAFAQFVHAQDSTSDAPSTLRMLEEIIVTAQHRAQDERDVPIVITALQTEDLNRYFQGGEDIRALSGRVAGLHAESSNSRVAPRFYIRGLGNTDFDLASSQPVSVIMDEVVQENVILKSFPLFDIERIEVLKGPQGTLYGRNTPAGIIKINAKLPDFESDSYFSVSQAVGQVKNRVVEGAIGGTIFDESLAGRISFYSLSRPTWVTNDFPDARSGLGDIEDLAFRGQLLWVPSDTFKVLGSIRSRDYEAHPAVFRANAIGPFNNQLNDNFNRNRVLYDESTIAETLQEYEGTAVTLNMEFEIDKLNLTITSISAYANANGTSRGDVDGGATAGAATGAGVANPVPTFFPVFTGDGLQDFEQTTEELRFAFDLNRFNVQAGIFLFDSDFTILTEDFAAAAAAASGNPVRSSVRHTNEAWGVFGQVSYDLSDSLNITGGVRFTNDDKDIALVLYDAESSTNARPFDTISVSGDDVSWDAAVLWQASDRVNLFGRVSQGFRAPSIQGRSVAFGATPTTADSETITAFEGGVKFFLAEESLRINASVYYYTIKDQQFTSIGGVANTAQLVNAEKGVGEGVELGIEWRPNEWLEMNIGYSLNKTEIRDPDLRVEACGGGCDILDSVDVVPGFFGPRNLASVNGNPFPNAPKYTLFYGINLTHNMSGGSELFLNTDYVKQGKTNFFLYESTEFSSVGDFELGLEAGYRAKNGRYQISVFGRNVTNEANIKGGVDFTNITAFTNEPRVFGLRVQVNTI